jgi:hypothetical protein
LILTGLKKKQQVDTIMKRLIEYPLQDGGTLLIEVDEPDSGGVSRAARFGDVSEKAQQTFETAIERVRPAAAVIIAKLSDLAQSPEQIQVEFGLKLSAKAGAFIAAAETEANFKITLTWRRK